MREEQLCKHRMIPEWCHDCRHLGKGTIKEMVEKENLALVENFHQWPLT